MAMDKQMAKIVACIAAESEDRLDVRLLRQYDPGTGLDRIVKMQRGAQVRIECPKRIRFRPIGVKNGQNVRDALGAVVVELQLVVGLAIRVAMRSDDERAAAAAIWLSGVTADLKKESDLNPDPQDDIAAYINADEATLAAAAIDNWHNAIPLAKAIDNAAALAVYLVDLAIADLGSFPLPSWAPDSMQLERSEWRLERIRDGAMLEFEARRLHNCAATYAGACAKGVAVLYVVKRAATKRDEPSDGDDVTAAMAEIRQRPGGGGPRMIQLKGYRNRE